MSLDELVTIYSDIQGLGEFIRDKERKRKKAEARGELKGHSSERTAWLEEECRQKTKLQNKQKEVLPYSKTNPTKFVAAYVCVDEIVRQLPQEWLEAHGTLLSWLAENINNLRMNWDECDYAVLKKSGFYERADELVVVKSQIPLDRGGFIYKSILYRLLLRRRYTTERFMENEWQVLRIMEAQPRGATYLSGTYTPLKERFQNLVNAKLVKKKVLQVGDYLNE